MIKWFVKLLFGPLIREAIKQEIDYLLYCDTPKLDKLKIAHVNGGAKLTVWQALQLDPTEISLCITWIDDNGLEDFTAYRVKDLAELRHFIKNLKPKFSAFNSLGLHVKPRGSSKSIIESLIRTSYGDRNYDSSELFKAFDPLIEWIDGQPELLI